MSEVPAALVLGWLADRAAGDPVRGRFAVADGATESAHAGLWASLLVKDFVAGSESIIVGVYPVRLPSTLYGKMPASPCSSKPFWL